MARSHGSHTSLAVVSIWAHTGHSMRCLHAARVLWRSPGRMGRSVDFSLPRLHRGRGGSCLWLLLLKQLNSSSSMRESGGIFRDCSLATRRSGVSRGDSRKVMWRTIAASGDTAACHCTRPVSRDDVEQGARWPVGGVGRIHWVKAVTRE